MSDEPAGYRILSVEEPPAKPLTVADLSPIDLFSIIILALALFMIALRAMRFWDSEWRHEFTGRQNLLFWGGILSLTALPCFVGVLALMQ